MRRHGSRTSVITFAESARKVPADISAPRRITITATTNLGVTGELARWVADLGLDDVPQAVQERAKHLLLDGLAAGLVGAQLPWSRVATSAVLAIEPTGPCAVIGTDRTTSGSGAVLLNSTFIQGFELDDFHPIAPLHSGSLVIPVLLASAQTSGPFSGARALLAAIAGFEVGPRVGRALHGAQMLSRGWHSGCVFGTHTAAMTAGKLRGLDASQLEDALGMAATQSGGLMAAQFDAMSKRMQHGFAARNGFYAAGLAAGGYTGIKGVFEQPYGGFLSVFGEGHDPQPAEIVAELGERWDTRIIMIKSYAAQGGLHGAIEATLALRAEHQIDPNAVEHIDIRVGHAIYHHGWWRPERPLSSIGAQMNLGYAATVALLDGDVTPVQFTTDRLGADDVWSLLDRVDVHLDEAIEGSSPEERFTTIVEIKLTDGSVLRKRIVQPHGAPNDPVTNEEIVEKYHRITARAMPAERREAIEQAVLALDELNDINTLTDLLAPVVSPVLD